MSSERAVRVLRVSLVSAIALGSVLAICRGEVHVTQQGGTNSPITLPPLDSPDWTKGRLTPERARAINEDRHKKAQADLEKMTGLMNELNVEFDRTSKDEISVTVLRKAKELEKLARDMQSQLKTIAREDGSGERESSREVEFGLVHTSGEDR